MIVKRMKHVLVSMVVALAVIQILGVANAEADKSKGKVRSGTGIVREMNGDVLLLEMRKNKSLAVKLGATASIFKDTLSNPQTFETSAVLEITGKGKADELLATRIIILPSGTELNYLKQEKSGSAYGDEMKSTQIKAEVVSLEPLVVKNREHQKIKVALGKNSEVLLRQKAGREDVVKGDKVSLDYRDQGKGMEVEKLVILPMPQTRQTEK